jgi:hypothetical protein
MLEFRGKGMSIKNPESRAVKLTKNIWKKGRKKAVLL